MGMLSLWERPLLALPLWAQMPIMAKVWGAQGPEFVLICLYLIGMISFQSWFPVRVYFTDEKRQGDAHWLVGGWYSGYLPFITRPCALNPLVHVVLAKACGREARSELWFETAAWARDLLERTVGFSDTMKEYYIKGCSWDSVSTWLR